MEGYENHKGVNQQYINLLEIVKERKNGIFIK